MDGLNATWVKRRSVLGSFVNVSIEQTGIKCCLSVGVMHSLVNWALCIDVLGVWPLKRNDSLVCINLHLSALLHASLIWMSFKSVRC
eukprot:scaffold443510_cov19-Prasinocladus_malaysianus.AAC.1